MQIISQLKLFPIQKTICTASPKHFLQYKINMCSLNPSYFFKCCSKFVLPHQNIFLQYKINMCSLNPSYFFKCCSKLDCLYFNMTFLTKQRVKILTVKDLKYLQSYYVLHKLASVHANLLWEGRKSNKGYTYFLKSYKQHYRHYKISLWFIVKYFCLETLFVDFNYVVVKYKLLYFEDKKTAFKT